MIELVDRERDGVHVGMLSFWAPNENFVGLSTISYTSSYYTVAGNSSPDLDSCVFFLESILN